MKAEKSIVEVAYHLTPEWEKPSSYFFIPLSNFHSIGGKKRPANLCPSYIADLEKDLCVAFENKKIYVPERREENTLIGLKVLTKDLCRF